MPAKTLHVTNAYHETSGGIRTFYRALLDHANEQGRLMRLVVPADRDRVEEVGPFARIYHVAAPRSPVIDRRYRLLLPHRFVVPYTGRLWRIVLDEQPDVVEVCDKYSLCYFAGLLRKVPLARRPVVVGLTCERMDDNIRSFLSGSEAAQRFARWYTASIYVGQFDVHIANSPYTAGEVTTGIRPVYVAPMGVDVDTFTPERRDAAYASRLRESLGADNDTTLLLYAGRLSAEKNVDLLIHMIRELGDRRRYRLLMVGDGPRRDALEKRATAECPGTVVFLGNMSDRQALADLMANVDVFVHPNPREPFGIAPLEAMASGIPLVAPDRGGVLAYASRENAWLAPPIPWAFAAAIENIARYPAFRRARIARARATADRHRWPVVAATFFQIYDAIAAASPARASQPMVEELT